MLWRREKGSNSNSYVNLFCPKIILNVGDVEMVVEMLYKEIPKTIKNNQMSQIFRAEGNIKFGKAEYDAAMRLYNKSACQAETGSEYLGMAYANRALCFLKMKLYKECLADIELAKEANYPIRLLAKLEKRKADCLQMMALAEKRDHYVPTLSFKAHKQFANMAECVQIKINSQYGRHITTNRDLKIGQTILIEEAYAAVPCIDVSYGRCTSCLKEKMNFIPCPKCIDAMYCSKECLNIDNNNFHKIECNIPPNLSRQREFFRLALKTVLLAIKTFPSVDDLKRSVVTYLANDVKDMDALGNTPESKYRSFFKLFVPHVEDKWFSSDSQRILAATIVTHYAIMRIPAYKRMFTSQTNQRFLQHLILHHFLVVQNAVDLFESKTSENYISGKYDLNEYGKAMFSIGCCFNHSCVPNIFCYSVDNRLICKVIRPIKQGEQLFRSYFPGTLSYKEDSNRKSTLANRYKFECKCSFCKLKEWSPLTEKCDFSDDPSYEKAISSFIKSIKTVREFTKAEFDLIEENSIAFLKKFDQFHPINDTICIQANLHILWIIRASRR